MSAAASLGFDTSSGNYPLYGGVGNFRLVRKIFALLISGLSLIVVLGHVTGSKSLSALGPMHPSLAVGLFFSGIALYFLNRSSPDETEKNRSQNAIAGVLAIIPLGIGLLELIKAVFGLNRAAAGESMSLDGAVALVMASVAMMDLSWERKKFSSMLTRILIGAVAFIALVSLFGALYKPEGNIALVNAISIGSMSLSGAFLFLLLSVTVLMSVNGEGPIHLLASRSPGGFIARRLTFTIVATSLFFGWACLVGFQRNMLSPVVALSLLASINAVLAIAWINGVGRELNFMDEQRVNSERFLEEIIDAAPAVIYLRDLKGNLLRSNREFEQVRAACSEEQALFPPDGELSPAEARVLSERAGHSQEIECRMHGEKHTFLSQHFPVFNKLDRLVAIGVVATDITDRKKMEVALRKSEESFRVLADAIPVVVWTSDDQGRASYFNFRWLEYTGLELAESLDFGWKRALHPDDAETVQKALARGTVTLDPLAIETRLRRRDGTYRWHSTRAIPTVENNKLVRWFGTCIDIDDQKRLNDILENKVAERTQALTRVNHELEAFSYSVSHDLRAPLRSMDGFSRLVLEKYGDKIDDQGRSYLNRVRSASQSMAGIIEDLLMLSRIGRTEIVRESVDLSQLAEEIIDEKRRVEPERNVDVRIEGHLHAVGDASLLRIALFNLFDNAWKYTSKRNPSRIEFFSRNEPNGKKIFIVRDNGEGFDMAHADQLFKAFSRLHRSVEFPGTGIGLVTARRIFERHGGEIWAESALGQGATFSFTVPNKTVPNKREAQ